MTTLEQAPSTDKWRSFDRVTGYYKAPVTGQYQFHQACDDRCKFFISLTDPMNPDAKEELMYRTWENTYDHTFRSYAKHNWNNDPDAADTAVGKVFTDWV